MDLDWNGIVHHTKHNTCSYILWLKLDSSDFSRSTSRSELVQLDDHIQRASDKPVQRFDKRHEIGSASSLLYCVHDVSNKLDTLV